MYREINSIINDPCRSAAFKKSLTEYSVHPKSFHFNF